MRKKLTREQEYNRRYYQEHKGKKSFKDRRNRNAKIYRAKKAVKNRRNERLREKWATDSEYRKHISEYQKAWRKKRKLAAARMMRTGKKAKERRI